jgi:hypothetical protein
MAMGGGTGDGRCDGDAVGAACGGAPRSFTGLRAERAQPIIGRFSGFIVR